MKELKAFRGENTSQCRIQWESLSALGKRAFGCLIPYLEEYEKVIVVSHAMVIRQFKNEDVPYCGMVDMELNKGSQRIGYESYPGIN